ncbi:unnamed protein product, partial [Brassica napus]
PTKRSLGSKRRVVTPPPIHCSQNNAKSSGIFAAGAPLIISQSRARVKLTRVFFRGFCQAQLPWLWFCWIVTGQWESPQAARQQSTGSKLDPEPSPSEPILFPVTGSIFATSLRHIIPSTRGCSPWRPDRYQYDRRRAHFRPSGFSRATEMPDTTLTAWCSSTAGPSLSG